MNQEIEIKHLEVSDLALCYKPEGHGFDTRWGEIFKFM
jgi:hypothetical protein